MVRGGHKAYAAKILGQVNGLLVDYKDDSEAMLLQHEATLKKRVKILEQLNEEIFELTKAEEINAAIEEAGTFVESITEIIIQIDKTISLASNENSKSKDEHPTIVVSKTSLLKTGSHAKLPKLVLWPFSGDPSEFHSFCDFESSVDQNSALSDVDKINHLKSLGQGQAAPCISGFSVTAANYSAAVKCLKERFGDKRVIVNYHMGLTCKSTACKE